MSTKILQLLLLSYWILLREAYLEPSRTSTMEFLAEAFRGTCSTGF